MGIKVESVYEVEVDVVRLQPVQGVLTGLHDVKPRITTVVRPGAGRWEHLRGQHYLLAQAAVLQSPTDDPFGFPMCVAVTGVDQVDAGVDRPLQNLLRFGLRGRVGEVCRTQGNRGYLHARSAEKSVFYDLIL
jgi:hypothetical protein